MDQGGQVRPELDPAFLPQVRGQPGETMAVRSGVQSGKLHEKAGVAGGYEALDSDQSSDLADQDGWATGTPRKEAGVSACRGAGNQGNADRDARTDQPASAGTWLACFESTGISDSYGVVKSKWAATRETLGQGQAIIDFYARQGGGYPMGVGQLSESDAVDALRIPYYSSRRTG